MLPFLISEAGFLLRMVQSVGLFVLMTSLGAVALRGEEPRIVALHGLEAAEVRQQGFTLPKAMKVHVFAKGGGMRTMLHTNSETPLFAYGWILNATTREVVWQMDGSTTKREWEYWVADHYLDLPAGSYEAYFANHGFGQSLLFAQWTRNIDRRTIHSERTGHQNGFLTAMGADESSLLRHWREQVGNYGMEIYLPSGSGSDVSSFEAPLRWKNIVVSLPAATDNGHWTQAFHVRKAVTLHIYSEGEGSGRHLSDYGWITDARTRIRVWEMSMDKSQFAGGARKNRRQVETIQLPAGDYEASFITDDSHSPADWNAAPPCDPSMYGLTLAVPADAELAAVSLTEPLNWSVVAELVKVGNDQDRSTSFNLASPQSLRVYALAEGNGDEMADEAWIEDAAGKHIWTMEPKRTQHAGGATKNRQADEVISLPKGSYTLRFRTDDSHAFGHWNDDAPWDSEHYGMTVYAAK
jgi:hypothetical protein